MIISSALVLSVWVNKGYTEVMQNNFRKYCACKWARHIHPRAVLLCIINLCRQQSIHKRYHRILQTHRDTLDNFVHQYLQLWCERAPTPCCRHTAFLPHYTWRHSVDCLHSASTLGKDDMKGTLEGQEAACQLSAQLAAQLLTVTAEPD